METQAKRGFTLVEVTLAILVMAGGILVMVTLYSLGFRENRQSREDVAGAVLAERVLNPLVTALSSTNIPWRVWRDRIGGRMSFDENTRTTPYGWPTKGWMEYLNVKKVGGNNGSAIVLARRDPDGGKWYNQLMDAVWSDLEPDLKSGLQAARSAPVYDGMKYALVITKAHKNSPVVSIAMRAVRENRYLSLMSQPLYYTEVHFQGRSDDN